MHKTIKCHKAISLISKELQWCKDNKPSRVTNGNEPTNPVWRNGFEAGLKQAEYLLKFAADSDELRIMQNG